MAAEISSNTRIFEQITGRLRMPPSTTGMPNPLIDWEDQAVRLRNNGIFRLVRNISRKEDILRVIFSRIAIGINFADNNNISNTTQITKCLYESVDILSRFIRCRSYKKGRLKLALDDRVIMSFGKKGSEVERRALRCLCVSHAISFWRTGG